MQKIMKRLITFGDSFANYAWPMWPQLLAQDYDTTINYGRSGCGNSYIFNSFMTHYLTMGLEHDDTVIIEWSEPTRIDFVKETDWVTEGGKTIQVLAEQGLDYFLSDETVVLHQLTMMTAVIQFLSASGCNWHFMFLNDASMPSRACADFVLGRDLLTRYDAALKFLHEFKDHMIDDVSMISYFESINMPIEDCCAYFDNGNMLEFKDSHPTPLYTLRFLEEVLGKKLKIENINAVRNFATEIQNVIESRKEKGVINQSTIGLAISKCQTLNNYKISEDR
jgi:hypothetical protein